jgi:DnaK suppressor protein
MNAQQQETHRKRLVALSHRLKGGVSDLRDAALRRIGAEASGGLSNTPLHLADLAADHFEQEVAVCLLHNEQQMLEAITAALDRVDAGTFGCCQRCGKPIPEERLKAMPYASRCVPCELQVEQAQTTPNGPAAT